MLVTSALALNAGEKKRIPKCGKGLKLGSAGWDSHLIKMQAKRCFFFESPKPYQKQLKLPAEMTTAKSQEGSIILEVNNPAFMLQENNR